MRDFNAALYGRRRSKNIKLPYWVKPISKKRLSRINKALYGTKPAYKLPYWMR